MTPVETLAEAVNADPADVRVILASLVAQEDEITPEVIGTIHMILNPNQERTVPELYVQDVGPTGETNDVHSNEVQRNDRAL